MSDAAEIARRAGKPRQRTHPAPATGRRAASSARRLEQAADTPTVRQRRGGTLALMAVAGLLAGAGLAVLLPGPSHLTVGLELAGPGANVTGAADRAATELEARLAALSVAGLKVSVGPASKSTTLAVDIRTRWWGPSPARAATVLQTVAGQYSDSIAATAAEGLETLAGVQMQIDQLTIERDLLIALKPPRPRIASAAFAEVHAQLSRETDRLEAEIRRLQTDQESVLAEWSKLKKPVDVLTVRIEPGRLAQAEAADAMLVRDSRQLAVAASSTHGLLTALLSDCTRPLDATGAECAAFRRLVGETDATLPQFAEAVAGVRLLLGRYSERLDALGDGLAQHRQALADASGASAAGDIVRIQRKLAELCDDWAANAGDLRDKLAGAVARMADEPADRTPMLVLQSRYQRCLHRLRAAHRGLAAATGALVPSTNHRLAGQIKSLAGLERRVARRRDVVRAVLQETLARDAELQREQQLSEVEPLVTSTARRIQQTTDEMLSVRADLDLVTSVMTAIRDRERDRKSLAARAEELAGRVEELEQQLAARLARWHPPVAIRPASVRRLPVAGAATTRLALAGSISGAAFFLILIVLSLRAGAAPRIRSSVVAPDYKLAESSPDPGHS